MLQEWEEECPSKHVLKNCRLLFLWLQFFLRLGLPTAGVCPVFGSAKLEGCKGRCTAEYYCNNMVFRPLNHAKLLLQISSEVAGVLRTKLHVNSVQLRQACEFFISICCPKHPTHHSVPLRQTFSLTSS